MTRTPSRRAVLRAAGVGAIPGLAGCGFMSSSPEEQVRAEREHLSTYTDVGTAIQDGYRMTTPYVRSDEGVLGLPFVNLDTPELDPESPQVLFYDLREDGTYELLGVEWLVPAEQRDDPPSLFGTEFGDATPGETAFIPEHYGLHAWLFAENPDGFFAPRHSGVSPPSYIGALETTWNALDGYYKNGEKAQSEAGYANTEQCVELDAGGYGIPFVNTEYEGTELERPPVLLYRLSATWTYQLTGAEWYVPVDDAEGPPSLFGHQFHDAAGAHSPEFEQGEHYGLHVWLYTANPDGMFARFNPAIRC